MTQAFPFDSHPSRSSFIPPVPRTLRLSVHPPISDLSHLDLSPNISLGDNAPLFRLPPLAPLPPLSAPGDLLTPRAPWADPLAPGEIPVMLRLLQSATLVTDPASADAFIVPFSIGTYQTLVRWAALPWEQAKLMSIRQLAARLASHLPHLNSSTASRHVFFQSVDSVFVGLAEKGGAPFLPASSIVFHLGDDFHYYGRVKYFSPMKRALRFNNSIVVPCAWSRAYQSDILSCYM